MCALVTGVQTFALPISGRRPHLAGAPPSSHGISARRSHGTVTGRCDEAIIECHYALEARVIAHWDKLFKGVTVVDGSGAAAFAGDVAVTEGRIAAAAPTLDGEADEAIEGDRKSKRLNSSH